MSRRRLPTGIRHAWTHTRPSDLCRSPAPTVPLESAKLRTAAVCGTPDRGRWSSARGRRPALSAAVRSSAEGLRRLARKPELQPQPAACCGLGGPVRGSALLPLRRAGFSYMGLGDFFFFFLFGLTLGGKIAIYVIYYHICAISSN